MGRTLASRGADRGEPGEGAQAAMPLGRVRRAQGLANDERILDAAIETVATVGADALSLRDVAARAGFTYGALYGRYGNAADLLADLWERRLEAELSALVGAAAAWVERPSATVAEGLCDAGPVRRALVETMIVSGRIDDLAELVPDGTREVLVGAGLLPLAAGDHRSARTLALLALGLGTVAHTPLDGESPVVAEAATWLAHGDWEGPPPAPVPPEPVSFTTPARGEADDRDGPLLDATLRVIARSGFAGATLRRIGRATGRTSRVVYHAYGSHHRLLHEIIRRVAAQSRVVATEPGAYTDPVALSARAAGLLGPDGRTRRRLVLEFNLGAVHDPSSGPLVAAADAGAHEARASRFATTGSRRHASLVGLARSLRDLQFGLVLLEETAGGLAGGDWRYGPGSLLRNGLATNGVAEGA